MGEGSGFGRGKEGGSTVKEKQTGATSWQEERETPYDASISPCIHPIGAFHVLR
jgi:hypothetical protein